MKARKPIPRIAAIDVKIVKMCESSGNEQFFVRLARNDMGDDPFSTSSILEYSCWQTIKNNLSKKECLERAWFDAGFLARFSGLKSIHEIILVGMDDEETEILKNATTLFRGSKED